MKPERTSLEMMAPDVETAIERARTELGVPEGDLEVELLDEGDPDSGREVRIRVLLLGREPQPEDDVTAAAREVVSELLGYMEIEAEVRVHYQQATSAGEDPAVQVDIEGEDLGMLIGKRGETMAALQYIARLIMARKLDRWVHLNVDVGGYKKRREQQLRRLAQRMAQQVHQFGRPISLEPMPANERRIIHITLQDHTGVTTESNGEGDLRRVTIQPDLRR
ncbi:MAG: RNA-binding cell elongation regulator Jag/EloR [Anaerolineales bacterium]|jgi:spoIIIJ-associated protein|nr:RNA-binding cell elongation regulator Jag/EloR [Anaerolineales bacterium]HJO33731.1 RNA-binding cell elongation regulator Jag/EloR [Anaerolineales bacterium]